MKRLLLAAVVFTAACHEEKLAPHGRVFALSAPEDDAAARRAGCFSAGSRAGAGFGQLTKELGGLQQFIEPLEGEVRLVWIAEAYGYDGIGSTFSLRLLPGEDLGDRAVGLRESSYHQHNIFSSTPSELPDITLGEDHWVDAAVDHFHLPAVSIFDDYSIAAAFDAVVFSGKLYADENGLTVSGSLTGYVSADRVRVELERFTTARGGTFASNESALLQLIGGFDARLDGNVPSPCEAASCNAISVCLLLETEPIEIFTVEP